MGCSSYFYLERSAKVADEPGVVAEVLLDAALVVDPVAVPAQHDLPPGVAVEAVPVVPLIGQHILGGQAVCILFYSSFVAFCTNLSSIVRYIEDCLRYS